MCELNTFQTRRQVQQTLITVGFRIGATNRIPFFRTLDLRAFRQSRFAFVKIDFAHTPMRTLKNEEKNVKKMFVFLLIFFGVRHWSC